MASSGKKKTTMAKLMRESRLRERRQDKQARKDARKYRQLNPEPELNPETADIADETNDPTGAPVDEQAAEGALDPASR